MKSNKKENNTVSFRLLSAVDFFILLLREKTRVHLSSLVRSFGSGPPINLKEAVKKSISGKS